MSDKWYFTVGDREYGPVSFREMEYYLRQVPNWYDQYVWTPGFESWVLASSIPEFSTAPAHLPQEVVEDEEAGSRRSSVVGAVIRIALVMLLGVVCAFIYRLVF